MRRPRGLTADERLVWAEVLRSVRPLDGRKLPVPHEPAETVAVAAAAPGPAPPAGDSAARSAPERKLPPLAALERRQIRALARGRARAESRLDLHGLTQAEAHLRLIGFLRRAQRSGQSIVLVITGQGRGDAAAGGRGVLRRLVPLWLGLPELRGIVLGFQQAAPRQGGAGALYVRLRRVRPRTGE